jgi:hypothetical protein
MFLMIPNFIAFGSFTLRKKKTKASQPHFCFGSLIGGSISVQMNKKLPSHEISVYFKDNYFGYFNKMALK